MKRGRDDEKMLKPMFPRLHVNDTDKGGPRAPPRNKMALYEQLSIPSQRFNHHSVSNVDSGNHSGSVPPGSVSQGGQERSLHLQNQAASLASINLANDIRVEKALGADTASSLAQYNQMKKVVKEDDFMVPVFVNSEIAQSKSGFKNDVDKENIGATTAVSSCISIQIQGSGKDSTLKNCLYAGIIKEGKRILLSANSTNEFDQGDGEPGAKIDSQKDIDDETKTRMTSESYSAHENEVEHEVGKAFVSPQQGNGDASEGVSENSVVDSVSSLDISSDGIVGILGQKRFWKARRVISNQQRVFAVQVFELHRLIKVQKVLAGSPHLLCDEGAYLCKSASKTSPPEKLPPMEDKIKSFPDNVKRKGDDSERADKNHSTEFSAENAVKKDTSFSLGTNNNNQHQTLNCTPVVANSPPAVAASGGSWCYPPQPPTGNHQWLIPVMSPSEGLIYKPYPATTLEHQPPGSVYGGRFGHCMPVPVPGSNFLGPIYGFPTSYHQGGGFPLTSPGYFPGFGIPGMNMNPNLSGYPIEQMNRFGHSHNTYCAFPAQKNGSTDNSTQETLSRPGYKEGSGLQGSTGSYPNGNSPENAVGCFHKVPEVETDGTLVGDRLSQALGVIRVVPCNPRLATESAARIFRSIQEERKQDD